MSVNVYLQTDFRLTHLPLSKQSRLVSGQKATLGVEKKTAKTKPKPHVTFSYTLYTLKNFSLPLLKGSHKGGSLGALPKGTELGHPLTWCLFSSLVYETENR